MSTVEPRHRDIHCSESHCSESRRWGLDRWRLGRGEDFGTDNRFGMRATLAAPTLALVLGLIVSISGVRGSDWPAHLFRIELFREVGLTLWNGQWYGGHYTLGYSVVYPPLAAWFGPLVVGVASSVIATACFAALLQRHYGSIGALAACWFAVGTAVNLSVGRLPFALGLACGLVALVAYERGHRVVAVAMSLLTPLASPVAGAFLALGIAGVVIDACLRRRGGKHAPLGLAVGIGLASVAPVVITSVLFPDPGVFPFRGAAFAGVMASCAGLVIVLPPSERVLRIAAGLVGLVSVPLFVVANPLGGNMTRLVVLFVVPISAAALWQRRRTLVIGAAVPLALWMVLPGVAGAEHIGDPAADEAYHRPLLDFVTSAAGPTGRIEIPFTEGHWEVAYVAPTVPIARGWERQVDMDRNEVLYDSNLSAAQYHQWLDDNAVRWVAVPDVALDEGGAAEAALIERGVPWLRLAHTSEHWRIWEVIGARPIVQAPGVLVRESLDRIVIFVARPGAVLVRAWYMPYWTADGADACVEASDDGMLEVVVSEPGIVYLEPEFSLEPMLTDEASDACE